MTFSNPIALWLLWTIPIAALPFFLVRRKIREKSVPNLFLWEEVFEDSFRRSRSFGLRHLLSLILAILTLLTLVGAALRPVPRNADINSPIIVVFDNSASMGAKVGNSTRFEKGRRELRKMISRKGEDREMMILTTTGKPKIVTGFTKDYGILRKAVDELNPTERTGSIAHALQNARFFQESRPSGAIIEVISDGCFREDAIDSPHQGIDRQETTEGNSSRQKADSVGTSGHLPPHWTLVGAPAENLAITRFEARRVATGRSDFEIFLKVTNFSEKEAVFDIEIDREGMMVDVLPFTLPPGKSQERITRYTSAEGGILHARIAELRDIDDALPSDDEAFSPLPAQPELNLLYYGEEDHFLYHVLAAQKNARLTKIDDLPEELPDNSVLILYRELPDNPPRGNLLLVSPQNGSSFLPLGAPLDPSPLELVKPTSPLLQSIRWEEPVEGVREIPTDGRSFDVVAQTAEAPVIFSIPNGSTETIVFNFSWEGADLPLRTLFPILFTNAINRLRGGVSEKGFVIENSRLIWRLDDRDLRPVCVGPDGKGIPVAIDGPDASVLLPDRGGILTVFNEKNEVIHRFALPLSSEEESNLTPNPTLTEASESRQTPSIPARTPTGSILALMGLLLLIGEGYLYQRRWIE